MSQSALSMTPAEVDAILCKKPGTLVEIETRLVNGRVMRVYKNLFPSLRTFWLWVTNEHKDEVCVVFEKQRTTFRQMFDMSLKWAAIFQDVYGVLKGDRVAICSGNCPSYLTAFWACHLIGAVAVLANSMLARDAMEHCIKKADCKLILVDPQRADILEPAVPKIGGSFVVIESHECKGKWKGMDEWNAVVGRYQGDPRKILTQDCQVLPDDNCVIQFTSGTTGLPKGVLSTQRAVLTPIANSVANTLRDIIRKGEDAFAPIEKGPQKGIILPTPLFHVASSAVMLLSALSGCRLVLMRKWDTKKGVKLMKEENVVTVIGVPTLMHDVLSSPLERFPLENITYGGAPTPEALLEKTKQAFPAAEFTQTYGLTETNSLIIGFKGDEYMKRPKSIGTVCPVNDCMIVDTATLVETPRGQSGEIWLRGPSIMKEYWRDPEATDKVLTKDGWLRTGDLGCMDQEGYVYVLDRAKDIIIRAGENVDSVSVESALYTAEPEISEAAVVGVPDARLGELVVALVTLKPSGKGKVSEKQLLHTVSKLLPKFAVPVMILICEDEFEHTASGKVIKTGLKKIALEEWNRRCTRPKL